MQPSPLANVQGLDQQQNPVHVARLVTTLHRTALPAMQGDCLGSSEEADCDVGSHGGRPYRKGLRTASGQRLAKQTDRTTGDPW